MSLTVKHLHDMTSVDVLRGLITDVANGHLYRKEAAARALRKDDAVFGCLSNGNSQKITQIAPDISPYIKNLQINSLTELVGTIRHSGWDGIDPSGRMTSTSEDVFEFLDSLAWREQYWNELNPKAQGKLNAIIDSYGRWWRKPHINP